MIGRRRAATLALVVLGAGLLAGCSDDTAPEGKPVAETSPSVSVAPTGASIPDVVEVVEPSVVTVTAGESQGSGVVYRKDVVVTNQHVVGSARAVTLTLADGATVRGTVVGTDEIADLAVIRAARTNLPAAAIRSDLPRAGEVALAVGSPLGFENTVTQGIISGVGRQIPSEQTGGRPLVDLIQTDAAISPGNSGGGLFDAQGRLVGINEAYIPPAAGAVSLGFAIPSATVVDVADQLLTSGKATHPYLGVSLTELTDAVRNALGVDAEKGAVVVRVAAGSPAAAGGLRAGDVITMLGAETVEAVEDVYAALRTVDPGDRVDVVVQRGGDATTASVTLGRITG
ncbi:S1C family serine protease [Cryptosporangium minutisporangium]|uniref:PDZ domain-containing protein n=1 Tax=Cryptosporangium minutisporangium TaxID=113569 RepID=A0ABP6TBH3_9ACTN